MSKDDELKGLGGWLILLGIGLVISPIRLLFVLIPTYKPIFEDGTWEAVTNPASIDYIPHLAVLLIGEMAANTVVILAFFYLIYLFFSKHYLFPKVLICVAAVSVIMIPLDAWLVTKVFPDEQMFDPETTKEFLRSLVFAGIWIPYMFLSKRVQQTFVKEVPDSQLQAAQG
ncbi:MAG: DUF2569 domain-containing protein [Pseudomonas sp.]